MVNIQNKGVSMSIDLFTEYLKPFRNISNNVSESSIRSLRKLFYFYKYTYTVEYKYIYTYTYTLQ